MKLTFQLVLIFSCFSFRTFCQPFVSLECNTRDSVKFQYFKVKKIDSSLKTVVLEKDNLIIDFMEKFNDTIILTLNNVKVFEGYVFNSNEFLPTTTGFVVNNIKKNRRLDLRIFLPNQQRCVEIIFKKKYRRIAISKEGNLWLFINSDYTSKNLE